MKYSFLLFFLGTALCSPLLAQERYEAAFDISDIQNDKIAVTVKVPAIKEKNALFVFPKVVPGTYDQSDFGRYIERFRAFDAEGKKVKVRANDVNSYKIKKANRVAGVSYLVNDTWDTKSDRFIFQPAGMNFENDKQFVLNTFGMMGYFNGYNQSYPYQLEITHDPEMYGATSMDRIKATPTVDVFEAPNYVEMVDQPILYALPDTLTYFEGGAKIGIAVHSPTEEINAEVVKEWIQPITRAASFVLGNIPTDEYWFLLHFFSWSDEEFTNGGGYFGALEHKKSSLYFVPSYLGSDGADLESVKATIYGMATHEFLHILSPLNLHSEEIAYFDFYNTEMSRHLWLYEGVTEYLSIKSLLLGGVTSLEDMSEEMVDKIISAKRYRSMPFTEMSLRIIEPEIQEMFGNVYEKGALLAMALDVRIAELTNGQMDLIDLVLDLIKDYGIGKPFKDEELFDVIAAKVHPDLRAFFAEYFEADNELPLADILSNAGMELSEQREDEKLSFGPIRIEFDAENGYLVVTPGEANTTFEGPLNIVELNGDEVSFRNVRKFLTRPENDDPLTIGYMENGKKMEITVTPKLAEGDLTYKLTEKTEKSEREQVLFNKLFVPRPQ